MTSSSAAGKICAECSIMEPCILDVITEFPECKEKHMWSEEGAVHVDLLDEGEGCKGTIIISSECTKEGCPDSWLEEDISNTIVPLESAGVPNDVTLYYKEGNNTVDTIELFRSPWEYLSSITSPIDIFDEPAHYRVMADSCYACKEYIEIDVYPTVEVRFTTGLSYDILSSKRERTVKERRDEQRKSRQAMDAVKPKNKNKLREGWTYQTSQFEWSNATTLTVDFGIKICDVEYSHEYEEEIKTLRKTKKLEQLDRINKLVDKINTYFAPDPENKGKTREYSVFGLDITPVNIGVSYAYQYTDVEDGPFHFFGLYGSPFLEANFKIDIIQFICAYCKIESLVTKCREYLEKHGTSVECYIEVSPGINLNLGAVYSKKEEKWSFNVIEGNQLYLGVKGVVSATFKAEVFVVELSAETEATIGAVAGFELDEHDDGLDLALYHDGIVGTFKFSVDVVYHEKKKKKHNKDVPQGERNVEKTWSLSSPLKATDSSLRVNLFGRERTTSKLPFSSPIRNEPWAMGSNPNWGENNGGDNNYNGVPHN